jgi:hypothetical protein
VTSDVTSGAGANAAFVMRATTTSSDDSFLGNPDGTPRLIGMHFDVDFPYGSTGQMVFPDEGFVTRCLQAA